MSRFESNEWSAGTSAAGTWRLLAGQALTLQPRRGGVLRVAAGELWVTADGPHAGPPNGRGDRILAAGETVSLRAGERLVVEPVGRVAPARFDWDPLPRWPARRGSARAVLRCVVLLVPASLLTVAIWLGAAAESGRHRADVALPAATHVPIQAQLVQRPRPAHGPQRHGPPA